MKQTQTHSNVLIAVDAEIGVLERRVAKLHEIRRLAVELDRARLPAAAAPRPVAAAAAPKPRKGKRQSPRLEVTEIIAVARDVLADGPASVGAILKAAGRTRTPYGVRVTEAALEQLGAVAVGKVRAAARPTRWRPTPQTGRRPRSPRTTRQRTGCRTRLPSSRGRRWAGATKSSSGRAAEERGGRRREGGDRTGRRGREGGAVASPLPEEGRRGEAG